MKIFNAGQLSGMCQYAEETKCTQISFTSGPQVIKLKINNETRENIKRAFDRALDQLGRNRLHDGARTYSVVVEITKDMEVMARAVLSVIVGGGNVPGAFDALKGEDG